MSRHKYSPEALTSIKRTTVAALRDKREAVRAHYERLAETELQTIDDAIALLDGDFKITHPRPRKPRGQGGNLKEANEIPPPVTGTIAKTFRRRPGRPNPNSPTVKDQVITYLKSSRAVKEAGASTRAIADATGLLAKKVSAVVTGTRYRHLFEQTAPAAPNLPARYKYIGN